VALELCERYGFTRQRHYDAQLVATMLAHGIGTLVTENARDFAGLPEIEVLDPFAA
jgi:predicted nucleic acid-binding protein